MELRKIAAFAYLNEMKILKLNIDSDEI
jgi:hypothetical protein